MGVALAAPTVDQALIAWLGYDATGGDRDVVADGRDRMAAARRAAAAVAPDVVATVSGCETHRETYGSTTWLWCSCLPVLRLPTGHGADEATQLAHLHRVRAALDQATRAGVKQEEGATAL